MLILYKDGELAQAVVAGKDATVQECLKDGQEYVGKLLQEAPSSISAAVACVPVPPASTVSHGSAVREPKPTEDQKETRL